jgi:thiol-disulfide isomerase/thioredoxin
MSIQKYLIFLFIFVYCSGITVGQSLKNLSGQPFPEEILKSVVYNTKGQSTTLGHVLDSLKGNVVMIDFWASWCRACITESEFTKKIQKDYKEQKIVFLFLSTDTDYKQWLRGLAVINLDGVHFRIDPAWKKGIQDLLKIRGIPYYVLLDHENKIYDPKAPWPHLQKLRNELDMLLSLMKIK